MNVLLNSVSQIVHSEVVIDSYGTTLLCGIVSTTAVETDAPVDCPRCLTIQAEISQD